MKKIRIITVIILCLGSVLAGCAAADSSRKPDTEPLGLNERAEEQKGSEEYIYTKIQFTYKGRKVRKQNSPRYKDSISKSGTKCTSILCYQNEYT